MYRGIFFPLQRRLRAARILPALFVALSMLVSCNGNGDAEDDKIYGESDSAY